MASRRHPSSSSSKNLSCHYFISVTILSTARPLLFFLLRRIAVFVCSTRLFPPDTTPDRRDPRTPPPTLANIHSPAAEPLRSVPPVPGAHRCTWRVDGSASSATHLWPDDELPLLHSRSLDGSLRAPSQVCPVLNLVLRNFIPPEPIPLPPTGTLPDLVGNPNFTSHFFPSSFFFCGLARLSLISPCRAWYEKTEGLVSYTMTSRVTRSAARLAAGDSSSTNAPPASETTPSQPEPRKRKASGRGERSSNESQRQQSLAKNKRLKVAAPNSTQRDQTAAMSQSG